MKKLAILTMALSALFGSQSAYGLGLGIIIGEPSGLSVREGNVAGAAAWSFVERLAYLHVDYLFGSPRLEERGDFDFYYGIGAQVRVNGADTAYGLRAPFGVSYTFAENPIELFAEVAPTLQVVPDSLVDVNGGIGLRFLL